ncbi:MAG: hypothetical protein HY204_06920 [Nitrospirae bacterium]|nr:hypothetical protein [Nitrospirota bacterium]
MQTPRDQGLFFAVFFSVTFTVILTAWLLIPAHIKQDEDGGGEEARPKKVLKGKEALLHSEDVLIKADEILTRLEKTSKTEKAKEGKTKDGKTPKSSDKKAGPDKK